MFEEDYRRAGHYVITIDRYERPTLLGLDSRNPTMDVRARFHFTPAEAGLTRVRCEVN